MIMTKKNPQVKLIKFNMDKSIQIVNANVNKSIIEYEKEGFEARNEGYSEYKKDKLFGFIRAKDDKIKSCFIVRENDPAPLVFDKESMYGSTVTPDQLVYHEDESFSRKVSEVESKKAAGPQELIVKALGIVCICLAIGFLLQISIVGIPNIGGVGGN